MNRWIEKMRAAQQGTPKQGPEAAEQRPVPTPEASQTPRAPTEARPDPSKLDRLRALYIVGRLRGMSLALPGRSYPDLDRVLSTYFGRNHLRVAEVADLEDIADIVVRLPFLELNC